MTDTNPVQDARTRTKAPTLLTICVEVYTINLWPSDPLSHFVSLEVKSVPVCVTCMRVSKNCWVLPRDELRNSPPIDRVQGGEEVLKMLRVFSEHSVVFVNSGITVNENAKVHA